MIKYFFFIEIMLKLIIEWYMQSVLYQINRCQGYLNIIYFQFKTIILYNKVICFRMQLFIFYDWSGGVL